MAVITTARKPDDKALARAKRIALETGISLIERKNLSLESLVEQYKRVLISEKLKFSCHTKDGELFFHPNLSAVRIKNLRLGIKDTMVSIMQLKSGDRLLDCTAGLCADSIVASHVVGEEGSVTALEASLFIYLVVREGIQGDSGPQRLQKDIGRINLLHADYQSVLANLPKKSYDIVYFDPMFDVPVHKSSSLVPLRPLATYLPLSREAVEWASRVASRAVVIKQRSFYDFSQLGISRVIGGKGSKIAYGILAPGGNR